MAAADPPPNDLIASADSDAPGALVLSATNGEGSGSMSMLIHKALINILNPINERVIDLEEKNQKLENDVNELNDNLHNAHERLNLADQKAGKLGSEIATTNEELKATKDSLREAHDNHSVICSHHDVTRSQANRTESDHRNTSISLADLQKAHEQLDNLVRQLQQALTETNATHLHMNDKMSDLRKGQDGLQDRHTDLVKSMSELTRNDQNTRTAFQSFSSSVDRQRKEDLRSWAMLDDRTKNLESAYIEFQHTLESTGRNCNTNKVAVERVKEALDEALGTHLSVTTASHSKSLNAEEAILRRNQDAMAQMSSLEENIVKLERAMGTDKQHTLGLIQGMSDAIHRNHSTTTKNLTDVEQLQKTAKMQDSRLTKAETLASENASNNVKMKEQMEKTTTELKGLISNAQRDAKTSDDDLVHEIAKTNASLQETQRMADGNAGKLRTLQDDMTQVQAHVAKVSSGLDLAHEYVQGVGKGFHDTHRKVLAGQDGLLPPKFATTGGAVRQLPPVPMQTPRTNNGQLGRSSPI